MFKLEQCYFTVIRSDGSVFGECSFVFHRKKLQIDLDKSIFLLILSSFRSPFPFIPMNSITMSMRQTTLNAECCPNTFQHKDWINHRWKRFSSPTWIQQLNLKDPRTIRQWNLLEIQLWNNSITFLTGIGLKDDRWTLWKMKLQAEGSSLFCWTSAILKIVQTAVVSYRPL